MDLEEKPEVGARVGFLECPNTSLELNGTFLGLHINDP